MLKLCKIFVCDVCGEMGLPRYSRDEWGRIRRLPTGWTRVGNKGECLCPKCTVEHEALKRAIEKEKE